MKTLFTIALLFGLLSASVLSAATAPVQHFKVGQITRTTLTAEELSAAQPVRFVLKFRNYDELNARIVKGDVLTFKELAARYLPTHEAWQQVAAWASANGYSVKAEDVTHMNVDTVSTVEHVRATLQVPFAKVIGTDGAEYTAATAAAVKPAAIEGLVYGIDKIYPHLKPRPTQISTIGTVPLIDTPVNGSTAACLAPLAILQLYHVNTSTMTGAGETVVVFGGSQINPTDLTTFWTACGMSTTLAQFQEVDPYPSSVGANKNAEEETRDVEWVSAMAPKANILYISALDLSVVVTMIGSGNTSIHETTCSYGLSEASFQQTGSTPDETQAYAALAALGVTNFSSTGDYGSNTGYLQGSNLLDIAGWDPNGPLGVSYPATDPNVTAVGGTCVGPVFYPGTPQSEPINDYYSYPLTEGGWCLPNPEQTTPLSPIPNYDFGASTGGYSLFFSRPAWQQGANITGTMRTAPDVSAVAQAYPGCYGYFLGELDPFGGTSMSSPIWAGLCALVNQARTSAGLPPVGLLGPKLYPLEGTAAFNAPIVGSNTGYNPNSDNQTTSFLPGGNNGAYSMAPDYDLITGLGSPNMAVLLPALMGATITQAPQSQTMNAGSSVTFTVGATLGGTATETLSYQWQLNGVNLVDGAQGDGATVSGAQNAQLLITGTTAAEAGNYTCIVTFTPPSGGPVSVSSPAANLIVTSGTTPGNVLNLSARAYVGTGDNVLIGGFYIVGSTSRTILVQAVGPSLSEFNVTGTLQHPVLTIHDTHGNVLYSNKGWDTQGESALLLATAASCYALPVLTPGSGDSELLITLPPGGYTAIVAGANNETGVALCSIYELP